MKHQKPHLQDMLTYIDEIESIASADRLELRTLRAVERDLGVIGEAANRLTPEFRQQYPHIPWRKIIDLRNIIVHGYDKISAQSLWEIVDERLPELKSQLQQVITSFDDD